MRVTDVSQVGRISELRKKERSDEKTEYIVCRRCGKKITVEPRYGVQFCECGVYYRRNRGFVGPKWVLAGNWKGGRGEKEESRQADKRMRQKSSQQRR